MARSRPSYATGAVDGGDGDRDNVGGLVGYNQGDLITASYATGMVDGGDGSDRVGGLVGSNFWIIRASYGFGTKAGGEVTTSAVDRSGDASPAGTVASAAALTAANSSIGADGIDGNEDDNDWPMRVWDFAAGMNPGFEMDYRF